MVERVSINAIGDFFFLHESVKGPVGIEHGLFMRRGKITTPSPDPSHSSICNIGRGDFRRWTIGHLVCQTESPFVHLNNKTGQASVLGAI